MRITSWWGSLSATVISCSISYFGFSINSLFTMIYFGSLAILFSLMLLYETLYDALNVKKGDSE